MTSRPTVLASIVLALALLGDSLLYAVLPLHATTFGLSLASVGVLLSANRVVRIFAYPVLTRVAATGLRRFTIAAAALGAMSTLTFAFATGTWTLLASRIAWGIAFGSLSLSSFAYATAWNDGAGRRVGLSLSLRELGPVVSLTFGAAAVAAVGVRPTLTVFGVMSMAGVAAAILLPDLATVHERTITRASRLPSSADCRSLLAGFVLDGIFPATIGLALARSGSTTETVVSAGLLLAFKRVAVMLLAPMSGRLADRLGERDVTAAGFVIAALGAFLIAFDSAIGGAVLIGCGAAVTATTIPLAAAADRPEQTVAALARTSMARDFGAAAGPLTALILFDVAGVTVVYSTAAVMLALGSSTRSNDDDTREIRRL
jgi:MFS transporter, DHA1 family, inner membrane transport protein